MERVSRNDLSSIEINLLESKVLPEARRWLRKYTSGNPMRKHAIQTLTYWNENVPGEVEE